MTNRLGVDANQGEITKTITPLCCVLKKRCYSLTIYTDEKIYGNIGYKNIARKQFKKSNGVEHRKVVPQKWKTCCSHVKAKKEMRQHFFIFEMNKL